MLSESRTPQVRNAQDLGPVSPDMPVPGITLVFRRSAAQEAALAELLAAQQNPASPLYHHWLTPEAFAARFGVADSDIAATESWFASHGFHIESVARSRDRITFSGNAAQVQSVFGAELHHYRTNSELHFAPASDLTLPTSLASVTAAVLHLSDFRPKPNVKVIAETQPDYTSSSTQAHYLSPKDILTMYDVPAYSNNIFGSGQGLSVVGQSYVNTGAPSSLDTFQGNLTQLNPINAVLVPNSGAEAISPGDEGESEIDLEYSSGIAQNARIFFVYVGSNQNYSVFDALSFAITENIAPVVSISYGACETLLSPGDLDQFNSLFEQASAQGQTLVASSGDSGSTACMPFTSPGLTLAEQQALAVSFPASSPYVTAVGGTQMAAGTFAPGSSSYWTGAPNAGLDVTSSLLSYVPEVVWNEGSASNGIIAGGGGASAHYPRPSWQNALPGMPSGNYRLLPDIALQSSVISPGFILCTSDPAMLSSEGQTSSCSSGLLGSNNKYTLAGGTSFAAPIFAGLIALLNEVQKTTGQGNINPQLYNLAADSGTYASVFHDITSGTNACVAGATNCTTANNSSYAATVGYDEATGLGSIDFNALAEALPASSSANLQATIVLLTASEASAAPGQTVPIQISVQSFFSSSGTTIPAGNVSVSVDGTVVDAALPLSPGSTYDQTAVVSYNFVAPSTTGSHLITVLYPGDATHTPATATYSVMVGNGLATGSMSMSAGNMTVTNGSTGSTQVTVTPTGGYNGRVFWSLSLTGTSPVTGCYAISPLLINGVSTAKLTIGIGAACSRAVPADRAYFVPLKQSIANNKMPPPFHTVAIGVAYSTLLICGCLAGRRRKLHLFLLAMLFLPIAGTNMIGCGGGGSKSGETTTTRPPSSTSSYTVTLTGTDSVNGSIKASTTFTLTVN